MEPCYPVDCEHYTVAPMLVPAQCMRKYCEQEPPCYQPVCSKPVYCRRPQEPRTPSDYDCCQAPPQKICHTPPPEKRNKCPPPQPECDPCCYYQPCKTKYIMPCYRYEDGRIVRKFPVTAFKRNGMQDVEHSTQGTANFLVRHPRDVAVECEFRVNPAKVSDPAKVPPYCSSRELCCGRKKKPITANQPTVLMRRACEVACGTRKRKPFVVSSYAADPHNEIRRYHAEDERGNCCFHFERKKPPECEPSWFPGPCCQPFAREACYAPCEVQSCPECQYVDCVYAHP